MKTLEGQLPLRLAREICQRFLERRVMSVSRLPEAMSQVGLVAKNLLSAEGNHQVLASAGDLVLRLIERGRLGTPQAAVEALTEITEVLCDLSAKLDPQKASIALRSAVDLTLKLLETNAAGVEPLAKTLETLALTCASLLPEGTKEGAAPAPTAAGQGPSPGKRKPK
jgi:hypothetical protein